MAGEVVRGTVTCPCGSQGVAYNYDNRQLKDALLSIGWAIVDEQGKWACPLHNPARIESLQRKVEDRAKPKRKRHRVKP